MIQLDDSVDDSNEMSSLIFPENRESSENMLSAGVVIGTCMFNSLPPSAVC